jgi:hypothetical protein
MTLTAPTTDTKTGTRELPGDGKLNPVHHIVRIVVVRLPADSRAALQSGDPAQSHGLTDGELRAGEAVLKEMDAPPPSNVLSGSLQNVTSTKPKKMFDVLKPTDIVVMGREPASVRTSDSSGKHLGPHDDRNKNTVLRVWTESDTIEYQCDEEFAITNVARAGWKIFGAPDNPFEGPLPYRAVLKQRAAGGKPLWVWTSSVLPAAANNQQYKATFMIGGESIDPDVVCGDPPPN